MWFSHKLYNPLTIYCLCSCCHKTAIPRLQCIIFKESKYNFDNTVVVEALSNRFSITTSKEYISKKCDKDLLEEIMPINSVALYMKLISHEPQQKCIHCNTVPTGKFLTFDKTKYEQNTIVSQMKENDEQNIICNKCYNAICRESLVTCLTCTKTMKKNVYIEIWFEQILLTGTQHKRNGKITEKPTLTYAKAAMKNCNKKITCVCCNRHMQKHVCKMYNKVDYDFTYFVVLQCLWHVSNSVHEEQYICTSCDKRLKETSNENPVLPYHAKYSNIVKGANFLKALNQRPEYVCTCCHHMLFCKTVQQFNIKDYDMSNETIKECLSHQNVKKLYRHTCHENDDMTPHKWPQFVPDDMEHDNIYVMNEFICICCRNSLRKKMQRCLTRHVQMVCSCMAYHRIYRTYYH